MVNPSAQSHESTDATSGDGTSSCLTQSLSLPSDTGHTHEYTGPSYHRSPELSHHGSIPQLSDRPTLLQGDQTLNLREADTVIAIMGPSGTGKSTFINLLMGQDVAEASDNMGSCTQQVCAHGCLHPDGSGRRIILVDTPGFNDSERTDCDILVAIAAWLEQTYKKHIIISGILYLHSIANSRVTGTSLRGIGMFQRLCGDRALKNVILTTTFWDLVSEASGFLRESQLASIFWEPMIRQGSRVERLQPATYERAWALVGQFNGVTVMPLKIQKEMVDRKKRVDQTSAFKYLIQWWVNLRTLLSRKPKPGASSKKRAPPEARTVQSSVRNYEGGIKHIRQQLMLIFRNRAHYKLLLACAKEQAQCLLDLFQTLLDQPSLDKEFRAELQVGIKRLAHAAGLYPKCFVLQGVVMEKGGPTAFGASCDIYKGQLRNQDICLKAIRVYQKSNIHSIHKAFAREAVVWGQLSHPNLLPFYGISESISNADGNLDKLCLVSPWMMNGDINHFLKENPDADRLSLILDIAQGVAYLHANGVIHGDLKGVNILVTASQRACIADFGLSAVKKEDAIRWTSLRTTNPAGGTYRWQAPELYREDGCCTTASDIYAFSCVCYEVLTDEVPFHEVEVTAAVIRKVDKDERPTRPRRPSCGLRGLTDDMWELMQKCWLKDPTHRPNITAIVAQLLPFQRTTDVGAAATCHKPEYLSPSQFRSSVHGQPVLPSIKDVDRILSPCFARSNSRDNSL